MTLLLGAVSRQYKVALAIAILATVGWLVWLFVTVRSSAKPGSETDEAPNRKPYLADDALEGRKLDKALGWALVLMGITAVGLPLYWLREPARQEGAGFDRGVGWFEEKSIKHGAELFALAPPADSPEARKAHFGCAQCHGAKGEGGKVTFQLQDPLNPNAPPRAVEWQAPSLNDVTLRFRDEEIRNILVYGRPGTPMPAWGRAGGGPMNDQQINDLVTYLHFLSIGPEKAKEEATQYGTDGRALFDAYCARCHTAGSSYGEPAPPGSGALGPSLIGGVGYRQFPNVTDQVDWVTNTVEEGKLYGVRGISSGRMAHFGEVLTAEQIDAVVNYERGL